MTLTNAQLFRAAHRVAVDEGFAHGWPSCAHADKPVNVTGNNLDDYCSLEITVA